MPHRDFEDFSPGDEIDLGRYHFTRAEIIEFAREFDPAPFHLDEEAGAKSMLGGLAASGWHICAATMRMLCDSILLDSSSQGAPGIESLRWINPVFPGTTMTGRATILQTRRSKTRPDIGLVRFRFDYFSEAGRPVVTMTNWIMFRVRMRKQEQAEGGRS